VREYRRPQRGAVISWQDSVNAGFELACAILLWLNVRTLYRDKQIKGIALSPNFLYLGAGLWDLYYYPFLNQWISFVACLVYTTGFSLWLGMAVWYMALSPTRPTRGKKKVVFWASRERKSVPRHPMSDGTIHLHYDPEPPELRGHRDSSD
jgi:hypothetical protein